MLDKLAEHKRTCLELGLVFFLTLLRFSCYGFSYFPQLDDYIQYYTSTLVDFKSLVLDAGMLASRPLAGPLDILFWSHFWDHMYLALALIALMWAVSALLFRNVFRRYFSCGTLFLVFYALIPLGFEGTYWLSASSRIVVGMFFTSISLSLFEYWIKKGKKTTLLLWFPILLLSFCFYEQVLVLSLTLILLSVALALHRREKRGYCGFLSFLAVGIYYFFTSCFNSGNLSERMSLILPSSPYYFDTFLPGVFAQFRSVFIDGTIGICGKGFLRGLRLIASDGVWLYVLFAVMGLVLLARVVLSGASESKRSSSPRKRDVVGFVYAALLAVVPLTPFLIIDNSWISLRSAVVSFPGLALFLDILLCKIVRNHKAAETAVVVSLAALFLVASVSELHDYRETYQNDQRVASDLRKPLSEETGRVGILNLSASYLEDQNFYYHEHIHGATESDWALSGLLGVVPGKWDSPDAIVPLSVDTPEYYRSWNRETKRPDVFDALFWYDFDTGELLTLSVSGSEETGWTVSSEDGRVQALIYEDENENGFVEFSSVE